MNKVLLVGRVVRDPEIRYTQGGDPMACARFTVAVNRDKEHTDFPECNAIGRTAEILEDYVRQGDRIAVEGRLETGSYENKNHEKVYYTRVFVDRVELLGGKREEDDQEPEQEKEPEKPARNSRRDRRR